MKILKNTLTLILIFAFLISCNPEADGKTTFDKGSINISISGSLRGIEPTISLETYQYKITLLSPDGSNEVITLDDSTTEIFRENLCIGKWTITIDALNQEGTTIGSGSTTVEVMANQTSKADVTIIECAGDGTLTVSLSGENKNNSLYTLQVYKNEDGTDTLVKEEKLALDESNILEEQVTLSNGFYILKIVSSNEEEKCPSPETVRIVKGDNVSAQYSIFEDEVGKIAISINNAIIQTPDLNLYLSSSSIQPGDSVTITAKGLEQNCKYEWYVNNEIVDEVSNTLTLNNLFEGQYKVCCLVRSTSSSLVWSASESFRVSSESDVAERPTEITVSGDIIICLESNVLIPYGLILTESISNNTLRSYRPNYIHLDVPGEQKFYCTINSLYSNDFYYYLETEYDKSTGSTIVYVIIDRNIDNPAYIDFSFEQELDLEENDYLSIEFIAEESELFPFESESFLKSGFLPISNRRGIRRVKVVPDSYFYNKTYRLDNDVWIPVLSQKDFTLASGDIVNVRVTNKDYSKLVYSGLEPNVYYEVSTAEYGWDDYTADNNGEIRVNYFEYFEDGDSVDVLITSHRDGSNDMASQYYKATVYPKKGQTVIVNLKSYKINMVDTGIDLPAGRLDFIYDTKVLLPPNVASYFMYAIKRESDDYYFFWNRVGLGCHRGSNICPPYLGRLYYAPIGLEGYDVKLTLETTTDDEGPINMVTVHVDRKIDSFATLDVSYDSSIKIDRKNTTGINVVSEGKIIGYIPINSNDKANIKIEPGVYRKGGYYSPIWIGSTRYKPVFSPESFEATKGSTISLFVSYQVH